jgi:hypothetical protein
VGAFQAARSDLFGQFGSNYALPGSGLAGVGAAAGTRFYGAATDQSGGTLQAAGAPSVNQYITFTGPQPADPHTFTQATLHELEAAL